MTRSFWRGFVNGLGNLFNIRPPPSKRESQSSPQNPSAPPNPPLAPALLPDPELLRHYGQLGEGVIQTILNEFVAYGTSHRELATNKQKFDYDLQKREQRIEIVRPSICIPQAGALPQLSLRSCEEPKRA